MRLESQLTASPASGVQRSVRDVVSNSIAPLFSIKITVPGFPGRGEGTRNRPSELNKRSCQGTLTRASLREVNGWSILKCSNLGPFQSNQGRREHCEPGSATGRVEHVGRLHTCTHIIYSRRVAHKHLQEERVGTGQDKRTDTFGGRDVFLLSRAWRWPFCAEYAMGPSCKEESGVWCVGHCPFLKRLLRIVLKCLRLHPARVAAAGEDAGPVSAYKKGA